LFSLFGFGGFGLIIVAIALIDFIRRKPDNYWIFLIIFLGPIGSLIYILAEMLPSISANRGQVAWLERRRRISRLELESGQNPSAGNFEELGMLYLDAGNFAKAKWAYDQALARRTDSIDTFYRRGICETELGLYQPAAQDLEIVVRSDVNYDFGRALGLYANALFKTGDIDHARTVFQEAAKINTTSEFMVQYADFLASQGEKDEAKLWARRVLEKRPLMPDYQRRRERRWLRRAAELV
jgi:hypothetical protein